ncbi:MAG TPA: hypothetical protein VMT47_03840 [Polyangia bacterium]|nr:hypothetical protein [Polyangia bacterium]
MKVHPLLAASALLLVGVMAFATTVVVEHRKARARRPPPVPEVEDAPAPPRPMTAVVRAARPPGPARPPEPAPAGLLRVHVSGPHGIALDAVDVSARRRGEPTEDADDGWISLGEDDEADEGEGKRPPGVLSAVDLEPGRYDLRIEAPGMRTSRVDDVPTGATVVEVALARAPLLLGAVGALGGPGCAGVVVRWSGPDDAEGGDAEVNEADCTFVAAALPETGPITVVASSGTRRESALATLPLSGDPASLCVAPPCAVTPAALVVYVVDAANGQVDGATLAWTLRGDELRGEMGTSSGGGFPQVLQRRPGQVIALRAARGRDAVDAVAVVGAGVTEVVLRLPAASPERVGAPEADALDEEATGGRNLLLLE